MTTDPNGPLPPPRKEIMGVPITNFNIKRHHLNPLLLCDDNCLNPYLLSPPPGKCDGACFNLYTEEVEATRFAEHQSIEEAKRKAAEKEAAQEMEKKEAEKLARKEAKDKARAQAKAASLPPRRRGGQPGNQNAFKNGYYSKLTPARDLELIKEVIAMENLDLTPEVALARIRYVKSASDPYATPADVYRLGRNLMNMIRTRAEIDKVYGPLESDESEIESVPDSRLES
ncbi:MAG: cell envelope integrity protein TolA [SAR202 cluster bacterium]|nr:cell envelope integrity protein TolA [SAR202 cluster bacterium]